ncbi:hypothetical protein PF005_g18353 [Phytophthora fragariae]|uniref:Apple domain-containing protein n=2 Tax=Phytophthora TaxID=4783 RepID=A0A6A3T4M5_9STRA|nr:hypothetical protein PF003_g21232 [Phytophthora fragariae]KAE8998061.1 hypothetical protein PR002_g18849 [Phytophthora rubi]KAE8930606.1 hypothetical protein PF009_g19312 [Phytophthora fragariae]KAE8993299.1 hypothetical protein PF011_g17193 [Phytophthora fragariae]KAE9000328.1 hypothetical protein PR001_g18817 [Phytophthora rubi]
MKVSTATTLLAAWTTVASAQFHIRCQNTIGGPCGDSSRVREMNCCDYGYCQPWNSGYYQCLDKPELCPDQETDIDYYGNDLETIYGVQPDECCEKCASTSGCAAYTFVNENPDGITACYLKTSTAGRVEKKGAVSAAYKDFVEPTCTAKAGDPCGNANSGRTCCPAGAFCQPWNPGYYQCIALPDRCPTLEVGMDFYGDDLSVHKGLLPDSCCDACNSDSSCKAFTFVNKNDDGQSACYLKTGGGTPKPNAGAVSGYTVEYVA